MHYKQLILGSLQGESFRFFKSEEYWAACYI